MIQEKFNWLHNAVNYYSLAKQSEKDGLITYMWQYNVIKCECHTIEN